MVAAVVPYLFLLFLCWITQLRSLDCYYGTAAQLNVSNASCTVNPLYYQDSCISGVYNTLFVPIPGSDFYQCGNCTVFQGLVFAGLVSNVSCCFADYCQTIAPPPSPASCTSYTTESACQTRPDCYWCGTSYTSLFGMGMCQSFLGYTLPGIPAPQLPPWALGLGVTPQICETVTWQPFVPAYTVNTLTLDYLTTFGLPAIYNYSNQSIAIGVALDVLSRVDVHYLNDTYRFCQDDDDLINWCGVTTSRGFPYCVISETWPQPDIWGWIINTTFTGGGVGLAPLFPADRKSVV